MPTHPLHLAVAVLLLSLSVDGFGAWTCSSFARRAPTTVTRSNKPRRSTMVMYEPQNSPGESMWSVLATTEKWLANIVGKPGPSNPYKRKEISYVAEVLQDDASVLANIWRRLREARELGEQHGQSEVDRAMEQEEEEEEDYQPHTFRSTQVIVIPNNDHFSESFHVFDNVVNAVNQARRNARDLVTDIAMEKLDDRMQGEAEDEWSVSVNAAHMHPKFGAKTQEEILQELKEEEAQGEVDMNMKAYKERRVLARRSPFPTLVLEVKATPPPDFGQEQAPPSSQAKQEEQQVTSDDIQKLEALFGKSAAMDAHPQEKNVNDEDDFYNALSNTMGIEEISLVTPMILAQNWIAKNDADKFNLETSTFTVSDARHVDAGYEFVFTNVAMQESKLHDKDDFGGMRQYLVMDRFLSSSATSLEKFATQVKTMLQVLPGLKDKVSVETFHPEHVDKTRRGPVPIIALDWKNTEEE